MRRQRLAYIKQEHSVFSAHVSSYVKQLLATPMQLLHRWSLVTISSTVMISRFRKKIRSWIYEHIQGIPIHVIVMGIS